MSELYGQLNRDVRMLLADRLGAATVIEVFSKRDDMTLKLIQEPDGRQVVSRVYEPGYEEPFSGDLYSPDLDFASGLTAMTTMFNQVGLMVVQSSILPKSKGDPTTVLSEYIPGLLGYTEATLEAKGEAIKGLAKMLDPKFPYLPAAGGLAMDMFMYTTDKGGAQHPIVVDNEPRLVKKDGFMSGNIWIDMTKALFIEGISARIEAGWGRDNNEKAALALAFFAGLNTIQDESVLEGQATLEAIINIHAFTQPELMEIRNGLDR